MLQIDTENNILINGRNTGLKLEQRREGTVIYTPEIKGIENDSVSSVYKEHKMPHARYSAVHDNPKPMHATPELEAQFGKPAGRAQLEADIRKLRNG